MILYKVNSLSVVMRIFLAPHMILWFSLKLNVLLIMNALGFLTSAVMARDLFVFAKKDLSAQVFLVFTKRNPTMVRIHISFPNFIDYTSVQASHIYNQIPSNPILQKKKDWFALTLI